MSRPSDGPPGVLTPTATAALRDLMMRELRAGVQHGADPARLRVVAAELLRSARPTHEATGTSDPGCW